jgi:hypothetical protein
VNYSDRVVVIRVAPGAKHHGTQTEWADFYSGATKAVKFHAATLWLQRLDGSKSESTQIAAVMMLGKW